MLLRHLRHSLLAAQGILAGLLRLEFGELSENLRNWSHTLDDFFLPDPHLVVHQPMSLHAVTQMDEIPSKSL